MRGRGIRLSAVVAVALAACGIGMLVPTTASAATDPIVVGSCQASIQGTPGQQISLAPTAVTDTVADLITAIPLLGPPLAAPFRQAFTAQGPLPLGAMPTGQGTISGDYIADQVINRLTTIPLLGPVLGILTGTVRQTLTSGCEIAVNGVNAITAPVQTGVKALTSGPQQTTPSPPPPSSGPGSASGPSSGTSNGTPSAGTPSTAPLQGNSARETSSTSSDTVLPNYFGIYGRVPLFAYADLPFAIPGRFAPAPSSLYGAETQSSQASTATTSGSTTEISAVGDIQVLPPGGAERIATPVLLAVLALACAIAVFVRAMTLRRVEAPRD